MTNREGWIVAVIVVIVVLLLAAVIEPCDGGCTVAEEVSHGW